MRFPSLFALLLTLAHPPFSLATAQAQTVDQVKFKRFVDSPLHTELLARAITAIPKDIFARCPALKSAPSRIALAQSIAFAADGIPNRGAWWEHLPVAGCGNDTTLNIFFTVNEDQTRINTVLAYPGGTRASIVLQKDALKYALLALEAKEGCTRAHIRNTRFGAFGLKVPADAAPGASPTKSWWETWTLGGCGKSFDVLMQFVPEGTGTKIIAPIDKVVVRQP